MVIEDTRNFNQSFALCIDGEVMKRYDAFVTLFLKIATLPSIILPLIILYLTFISGPAIQLPILYEIALMMFGVAVYVAIAIIYQYAKSLNKVRLKIQIIIFGILCLLFGVPGLFIQTLQVIIPLTYPSGYLWIIATVLWYIGFLIWGVILDSLMIVWVEKIMNSILVESTKPFKGVLAATFTNNLFRLRTMAYSVCVIYTSFIWLLIKPESWSLLGYALFMLILIYFFGKPSDFDMKYYGIDKTQDLATFILKISNQLWLFGIRNYVVYYNQKSFKGYASVFSVEVYPEKYDKVLVIYQLIRILNFAKIQNHLNEQWNQDLKGKMLGRSVCPFREFDGRILIDFHIWNADNILWWGPDHRYAIVVPGVELRRNQSVIPGDFCDD